MEDHYLKHIEKLRGQPKYTLADYIEVNGILVPKRFASFDEAKA